MLRDGIKHSLGERLRRRIARRSFRLWFDILKRLSCLLCVCTIRLEVCMYVFGKQNAEEIVLAA